MRGTIIKFDSFVIVLIAAGQQRMIYKHSISTIVPTKPLKAATPNETTDSFGGY